MNKFLFIFFFSFFGLFFINNIYSQQTSINRYELVHRHFPAVNKPDSLSPFTVGNGEFAFTADITGLQSFPAFYENGIPLAAQSQWGWHSIPNPNNYTIDSAYEHYNTYGRKVPYASGQHSEAGQWLRANPHRLHLGRIGFNIKRENDSRITLNDIKNINQTLDLWEGIIKSSFTVEADNVEVETVCNPAADQVAVGIKSTLLQKGKTAIEFEFPYGSTAWGRNAADWNSPDSHSTEIVEQDDNSVMLKRKLDAEEYYVSITWQGEAEFKQSGKHLFLLTIAPSEVFSFTALFLKEKIHQHNPDVLETIAESKEHWQNFWETGGAVDLSESSDPRANELERRIILSRYLTAVQCAGSMPPQETGLTFNSWYGKFHLEMHWWHAVQFALWGKPEMFEKSLGWYNKALPSAKKTAEVQGYTGARWPKMPTIEGREGPSTIGAFLIWQQPHPVYYAELLYRTYNNKETLEKYKEIVFESAKFMASYAYLDSINNRYVLGPPLIPAQERYKPESTINPAFELSYWLYGLKTAQAWRERLNMPRSNKWDDVINRLSSIPVKDGLYQNAETAGNTFDDSLQRSDHPTVLGSYGMIPNSSIDTTIMKNTLEKVMHTWDWQSTWGWDYPMIAMNAARLGNPSIAIDALLMDVQKNTYLNNGHNYQDKTLTIYLPGNGGLLTAIAMMCAGWDGAPNIHAPGFPRDGKWKVKFEGLYPLQ
ncbi:MAG: hypothetical protein R6W90_01160 [Ignavibacteriaceae bacterium]